MLCLQQRWADLAGAINTKLHCRDFSHEPRAGSDADRTDEDCFLNAYLVMDGVQRWQGGGTPRIEIETIWIGTEGEAQLQQSLCPRGI